MATWQRELSDLASRFGWACRLERWSFGRFSLLAFLTPWTREAMLRWLRRQYDAEIHDRRLEIEEDQTPSIVAHSFGTYILGYTLLRFDFIRFDKVILCGSILPTDFPWDRLIERGQVQAVRNEYGVRDPWVKRVRWFVRGTGPSGASGFACRHDRLEQEEFDYDHSEYFGKDHMQDRWVPFLQRRLEPIPRKREAPRIPRPPTKPPGGLYLSLLMIALLIGAVAWVTWRSLSSQRPAPPAAAHESNDRLQVTPVREPQEEVTAEVGTVYDVAVVEMIPRSRDPVAAILSRMEPYPGFPFFSRESDHPSQWPPRVFKDRGAFAKMIKEQLAARAVAEELRHWRVASPPKIEIPGMSQDDPEFNYTLLRNFLSESPGDYRRVQATVGPACAETLPRLEAARRSIEEGFPNRLLVLRVVNQLDRDVEHFKVEIRISGEVYDVTLNAQGEKTQSLEWTPERFTLEIPLLRPTYTADIFVWYYTQPLERRAFPGPTDVKWAQTQGIVIENLVASNVRIVRSDTLLKDLSAYHRYPVDPVRHSPTFGRLGKDDGEGKMTRKPGRNEKTGT